MAMQIRFNEQYVFHLWIYLWNPHVPADVLILNDTQPPAGTLLATINQIQILLLHY